MRKIWQGGVLAAMLLAAVPAAWADSPQASNPDPWEGFNRKVFHFNDRLDTKIVKPAATFYRRITPQFVMDGIGNFFVNLSTPVTVANDLFQGHVRHAISDTGRFVLNTTVGIGGLFDVASRAKLPSRHKDFGMTLAVWGSGPGPYVMLPFFGPSTVRDLGGRMVDWVDNPVTVNMSTNSTILLKGADSFNQRAALIPMEGIVQGDKYLFVRDLYLQHRDFEIHDGRVESDPFLDDSSDDSGSDATVTASASPAAAETAVPAAAASSGPTADAPAPMANSGSTP